MGRSFGSCFGVVAVSFATPVFASPFVYEGDSIPIEYSAGSGPNASYLLLDFQQSGGGLYAFEYRWADSATAEDMILALDAAGSLAITGNRYGESYFVSQVDYEGETTAMSPRDVAFYEWQTGTQSWLDFQLGLSDIALAADLNGPGEWVIGFQEGWYDTGVIDEWGWPVWSLDGAPRATVIPEPTALALLTACGFGGMLVRRRS